MSTDLADRHHGDATVPSPHELTPEQRRHFETFGFLVFRGLFAPEIARITAGFEHVFASEAAHEFSNSLHYDQTRHVIGPGFVDRTEDLAWLRTDPRLLGIVTSLVGADPEYNESDGNLFSCDTGWHSDLYGASMDRLHVKVYFYLDPLRADTGALRMMPGTNGTDERYAAGLRADLWSVSGAQEHFGVDERELPCVIVETDPGDVIVGDYRTMHATFGGAPRRRLFTVNFSQAATVGGGEAVLDPPAPWLDPTPST